MTRLVDVSVSDLVATVTLNRPPANALNAGVFDQLIAAFERLNDAADVHAIVLTGAGRIFCGGGDLKERRANVPAPGEQWTLYRKVRSALEAIRECRKPVIGAINGAARGGGLNLVAVCDILFFAEGATIGLTGIDIGIIGGTRHAMELLGRSQLRTMLFTGQPVTAQELYRLGVIQAVLSPDKLMDAAMAVARAIAAKDPRTVSFTKIAANASANMEIATAARFENEFLAELVSHAHKK